jgi:metallo-beta-lactamase class B
MKTKLAFLAACALASHLLTTTPVPAQDKKDGGENLAALLLTTTRTALKWDEPADPARVVGPIYFVGTKGLGSFLITGSEGHVVLYTGMPGSGPMIEKSIVRLGFNPKDVKLILTGHAHCDHAGGHAYLKKITGAKIAMMREEVELFESGGKLDFQYGDYKAFAFEPAKVDTVFRDEDEIKLGDISLRALLTPGHTKGSTTYVMKVVDGGKTHAVAFPDGSSVNPGYRVARNPSYKGIEDDFRRTFRTLAALKPDVWLAPHNEFYGLDAKLQRAAKDGAKAWVDPEGYRKWVAGQKERFEAGAARERAGPAGGPAPVGIGNFISSKR